MNRLCRSRRWLLPDRWFLRRGKRCGSSRFFGSRKKHVARPATGLGGANNALRFQLIHQSRGTIVADVQSSLQERSGNLVMLAGDGYGARQQFIRIIVGDRDLDVLPGNLCRLWGLALIVLRLRDPVFDKRIQLFVGDETAL